MGTETRGRRLSQSKKTGSQFEPVSYGTKEAAQKFAKQYNKGSRFDTRAVIRHSKAKGRWTVYFIKRDKTKMKQHKKSKPRAKPLPRKAKIDIRSLPGVGMKLPEAMQKAQKTGRYHPDYQPSWEKITGFADARKMLRGRKKK